MKKEIAITRIAIFRKREIRKTIHKKEWWFVVEDVVAALTDSVQPKGYIKDMRRRDPELSKGWGQIATPLSVKTPGGVQKLNCANTEGIFRIIQSIPSPKAEPFKRWLAKVGYERIQEIENPELATKRTRALYKAKGYSDDWIEKRMRGIAIREELTDQWQKRGIKEQKEYEILTAEISKATFEMTPPAYKKHKGLKRENLRDHMTDLELIFSMLGEASTKEITVNKNTHGKYGVNTIRRRFGSWNKALQVSGLEISVKLNNSEEDLFENIAQVWQYFGRQPAGRDVDKAKVIGISRFSLGTYEKRFDSKSHCSN